MSRSDGVTKAMAVIGTVLTWIPLAFAILLSLGASLSDRGFRFDWLLPAELFPLVLAGGLLLLWAAARAHRLLRPIAVTLVVLVAVLVGGQALAVASGLADGRLQTSGWQWTTVVASIALYTLGVIVLGVLGLRLARDLWSTRSVF